jgi:hypothetical protein
MNNPPKWQLMDVKVGGIHLTFMKTTLARRDQGFTRENRIILQKI